MSLYHLCAYRPVTCCEPCALGLARGRRRPGVPETATVRAWAGTDEVTLTGRVVLDGRYLRLGEAGPIGVCPLCGQTRPLVERGTALLGEAPLPGGTEDGALPDDTVCLREPALPEVTVAEAVEEVQRAVDAQIARGWLWRGTRWSASERAQLRWSRLDTRAEALEAGGALPLPASNLDDTITVSLDSAATIHEAATTAERWVIGWVSLGSAAKGIVTAAPEALPAVLAALAADTPQAAGGALAALARP